MTTDKSGQPQDPCLFELLLAALPEVARGQVGQVEQPTPEGPVEENPRCPLTAAHASGSSSQAKHTKGVLWALLMWV